jgi:hypothetical protein
VVYTSCPPQTLTQPTFQPSTETMSVTYGATSPTNTRLKIHVVKSDGAVWKGLCGVTLVEGLVVDPDVREVCAKCEKSSRSLEVSKRVGAPSAPGDVDGGARRGVAAAVGTGGGAGVPTAAVVGVRAASSTGAGSGGGVGRAAGTGVTRPVKAAEVVSVAARMVVGPGYTSSDVEKQRMVNSMWGLVDVVGMYVDMHGGQEGLDKVIGRYFTPGWRVGTGVCGPVAVFVSTTDEAQLAMSQGYRKTQEFYPPLGDSRDPFPMPDDCIIWSWMFANSKVEAVLDRVTRLL